MIVSKSGLLVVEVTRSDKVIPILDNIHIEADGTCVGSNGKVVMAISPVNKELKEKLPFKEGAAETLTIPAETIREVLKNMPRDTMFSGLLEHCNVKSQEGKEDSVTFELTDGKRTRVINGKRYPREYIGYRKVLSRACTLGAFGHKFVLNRKRLLSVLLAIEKVCPDSAGFSPLFFEFDEGGDIVVRCINQANGQRVVAVMSSQKGEEGKWLEYDRWETELTLESEPTAKDLDPNVEVVLAKKVVKKLPPPLKKPMPKRVK